MGPNDLSPERGGGQESVTCENSWGQLSHPWASLFHLQNGANLQAARSPRKSLPGAGSQGRKGPSPGLHPGLCSFPPSTPASLPDLSPCAVHKLYNRPKQKNKKPASWWSLWREGISWDVGIPV